MAETAVGLAEERRERTLVLFLDRPPANTLTTELLRRLKERLDEARWEPETRALVLASRSPKYFSAGLEAEELVASDGPKEAVFHALVDAHRALAAFPKPTAAAIEGAALLGGFILALGCDLRVAGEANAKVSLSEVRLGLTPTRSLITLAASLCARPAVVKDLVLAGRTLKAREAFEGGLVDRLAPDGQVLDAAAREAEKLSKLPPRSFAAVKRTYRQALCPDELWEESLRDFRDVLEYGEAAEGLAAVREKRRPRWE